MTNFFLKAISPQGKSIYSLLLENNHLTAKEIGERLNILPHAVYRATKSLVELGVMVESSRYPIQFAVVNPTEATNLISLAATQDFKRFLKRGKYRKGSFDQALLDISFIQNRQDLLEKTTSDVQKTQKSIDFIVSGLEIPAENTLAMKRAIERGV